MGAKKSVRSYDYVNHPYETVKDIITGDALGIFQEATKSAAARAQDVAAELHVNVAGLELGKEVIIKLHDTDERPRQPGSPPRTTIGLSWGAAKNTGLFPMMDGHLHIYPLSATETQLDFSGEYEVPLGVVGGLVDAVVGHGIAEASVLRFVKDIATHLRSTIKAS